MRFQQRMKGGVGVLCRMMFAELKSQYLQTIGEVSFQTNHSVFLFSYFFPTLSAIYCSSNKIHIYILIGIGILKINFILTYTSQFILFLFPF